MLSKDSWMSFFRRLKPSSDSPKRVLLLSSLRSGSGNAATAMRLTHELQTTGKFIVDCVSVDAPQWEADSLSTAVDQYAAIVALHAYRAGIVLTSIYKDQRANLPPLIIIFAGTELHSCEPKWIDTLERIIPHASGVVCFSPEWKRYAETTYESYLRCRITVIPQSVLLSSFNFEQLPLMTDKKMILWVGELRLVKDPALALRVASALSNLDYRLVLVGHEQDRTLGEQLRVTASAQPNITFLGVQAQSVVHTLMRTAFAYLNTSVNEGMCLAVLEAMTLDLPILARRNAGNGSIIKHEKTGLLFDTAEEAAECVLSLDRNTKLRHSLIQQAKKYVSKYHQSSDETKAYRNLLIDLIK